MEILRQLTKFTKSTKDKLQIYKIYICSVVEQSAVVWNSSLTKYNERELERVQKVAVKLISKKDIPYKEKLIELGLPSLKERRNQLSVNFAKKCIKHERTKSMFKKNIKIHRMKLRRKEKFMIKMSRTERLKKSAIEHMKRQLNKEHEDNRKSILKLAM